MHIVFGWGEAPEKQPYRVLNLSYSLSNSGGDETLANCVPGEISMTLHAGVSDKPGGDILEFARWQIEKAKDEGAGMISVYQNEDAQSSIQDIVFSKAKVTHFSQSTSEMDDSVVINLTLAPGFMTTSGVKFEHRPRVVGIDR